MIKKPSQEDTKKMEELQLAEQTLNNLLVQKQVFQLEIAETTSSLEELKKSKGDVFKIVGSLMIRAEKIGLEKELVKKKELLELRIRSIEKQEKEIKEKTEKIRTDLLKRLK